MHYDLDDHIAATYNVLRLMSKLTYLYFMTCKSKFQNKVVLPKKTREVHFITFLNIFSVALL
jgi:hypothetical protein